MMRQETSKIIQTKHNSQKLFLVKNYIEQELETLGYRGHVKYDRTSQTLIQYRVKEGTVAVLQKGKLCIFETPMKKFNGALPLEVQLVSIDSIQTIRATCCKKCHTWKQLANITRCPCGGYLVPRKRFSTSITESWDEEFLEIEFARKDIALAKKTDRVLSRKTKQYTPTGITANLAGMSSTDMADSHQEELLLIPNGDDVKTVKARPIKSCSLIFVAAISEQDNTVTESEKI